MIGLKARYIKTATRGRNILYIIGTSIAEIRLYGNRSRVGGGEVHIYSANSASAEQKRYEGGFAAG